MQVLINKTLKPDEAETYQRFEQLMNWVDEHRTLKVRTNADEPKQAARGDRLRRRRASACAAPSTCSSTTSTTSAR